MSKLLLSIISILAIGLLVTAPVYAYPTWVYNTTSGCKPCHPEGNAPGILPPATPPQLHGITAHTNTEDMCFNCHVAIPGVSTVSPSACLKCHPAATAPNSSLCPLINDPNAPAHGALCLGCHPNCAQVNTTTTTIPTECSIKSINPSGIKIGLDLIPRIRKVTLTLDVNIEELGVTCADLNIQNAPKGVAIISCTVSGNSIDATMLFWGVQPGTYNIDFSPCGTIPFVVSRF
jgi:hypothetical protein